MYPLLVTSIVALTFICERALFWIVRMKSFVRPAHVNVAFNYLKEGEWESFLRFSHDSQDPALIVIAEALSKERHPLKENLELECERAVQTTLRSMNLLDTIVTLAPLLGIFGTVTGIIQSFDLLGLEGIQDPHAVSRGIAQALITTAAGLSIAMPTLIAYNIFMNLSEKFAYRLELYSRDAQLILNGKQHAS